MSRIVGAFRTEKGIGAEKEAFLSFDGERMESNSRVDETEIRDMDCIDVSIK